MFKVFNCFQFVLLFAAFPFILSWINTLNFPMKGVAYYGGWSAYFVQFVLLIICCFVSSEKLE